MRFSFLSCYYFTDQKKLINPITWSTTLLKYWFVKWLVLCVLCCYSKSMLYLEQCICPRISVGKQRSLLSQSTSLSNVVHSISSRASPGCSIYVLSGDSLSALQPCYLTGVVQAISSSLLALPYIPSFCSSQLQLPLFKTHRLFPQSPDYFPF